MGRLIWKFEGFDGQNKIFEKSVPYGCISERQVTDALKALAANAGLSFDEIVGAYVKRRTKLANGLLNVYRPGPEQIYLCGDNPHFTARVLVEDDL